MTMDGHIGATIIRETFMFAQRVLTHLGKIIAIAVVSCLMRVDFKMHSWQRRVRWPSARAISVYRKDLALMDGQKAHEVTRGGTRYSIVF